MRRNSKAPKESQPPSITPFLCLILILCICIGVGIAPHKKYFVSDENNYWSAAQSLVHERDLVFDGRDLRRAYEHEFSRWPAWIQMTRKDVGAPWYYSKPVTYPLALVPLTALLGNKGIYLTNALLFFACIYLGYRHLRRRLGEETALFVSAGFYFLGLPFLFIFLIHAEMWDMFLCALGAFLVIHPMSEQTLEHWCRRFPWGKRVFPVFRNDGRFVVAAAVFALVLYSKYPNAFALVPLLVSYLLKQRRLRMAMVIGLVAVLTFFLFLVLEYQHSGHFSPKGGDRHAFSKKYPGAPGYVPIRVGEVDSGSLGTTIARLLSRTEDLRHFALNLGYFFFGRYSGMIWYHFTAVAILLALCFPCRPPGWVFLTTAIAGSIAVWLLTYGLTYFGQVGTVGNRYFLPVVPLFLYLFPTLKPWKAGVFAAFCFVVSGLFMCPVLANPLHAFNNPDAHTRSLKPFIWAPIERTQYRTLFKSAKIQQRNYNLSLHDHFSRDLTKKGFWLTGQGKATALLRNRKPIERLIFDFQNPGSTENKVTIKVSDQVKSCIVAPQKAGRLVFSGFRQLKYRERYASKLIVVNLMQIQLSCSQRIIPLLDSTRFSDPRPTGLYVKLPALIEKTDKAVRAPDNISIRKYPKKENMESLLWGWSIEEKYFWIRGATASLLLSHPLKEDDYVLTVKGHPYGPVVPLRVQVNCGDRQVGTLLFGKPGVDSRACLIPKQCLPLDGSKPLEIELICDKFAKPSDVTGGVSTDKRQLSLAVHEIRLQPQHQGREK
jgi:hypothetical protein